ncbi:hypothetical protein Sru01_63650 [Sphaerisporangium rufum]|uniref:Uncharacterized protein n=1 Tax=Sphaerisporangium rufum TaxID=1381558 RepID=A0A919R8X6_9ACTN|nr:hypothetical protein Sru01_63650 [Sphaerisporangium rufum]
MGEVSAGAGLVPPAEERTAAGNPRWPAVAGVVGPHGVIGARLTWIGWSFWTGARPFRRIAGDRFTYYARRGSLGGDIAPIDA